jgi:hypothetical protein
MPEPVLYAPGQYRAALMLAVLGVKDHRQQARPDMAARDDVEWRRRLQILSHDRHVNFSRTVWITFHCRGTTSSVSVIASPSLLSVPPQHGQAVGPGIPPACAADAPETAPAPAFCGWTGLLQVSGALVTARLSHSAKAWLLLNYRVSQPAAASDQAGAGYYPAASGRHVRTGLRQSIPSSM